VNDQKEEIYNILISQGYSEELFSELGKHKPDGKKNMKATCPSCGGNDFSFSLTKPVYRCFNCDIQGDWLDYLQKYRGMEFKEALQYLGDRAGVDVDVSSQEKQAYRKKKTKAQLLSEAQKLFRDNLWASEGGDVLEYLHQRGYEDEEIKSMGMGAYTDRGQLKEYLKEEGFSLNQMNDAGLFTDGPNSTGTGTTHQLALVWRDRASRPSGMVCRAIEDVEPKYLYTKGLKMSKGFIGYQKARGEEAVVVVEGILDAKYLNTFDHSAVAIGSTSLSEEQLQALEDSGTEEILIALDKDGSGQKGTEKIIKQLQGTELRPYVIDLPEGTDPDQLLREEGPDAFQEKLDRAQRGSRWLGWYIASRHNLETDRGKDKAVSEGMDTYQTLERGQRDNFKDALVEALPMSEGDIEARAEKQRQEMTQEKALNTVQSVERKLTKLRQEGNIPAIQRTLEDGLEGLKDARGITAPEPYKVEDFLADVNQNQEGLKTGYSQLDRYISISRGALTFIAGRPGHGKTTLKLNLLLNMIEKYPDQHFYFFSYEEARDRLSLKLIMNMAEVELNSQTNFNAYLNYFKEKRGTEDQDSQIESSLSKFRDLTKEGRLYLVSEAMKADKLSSTITHLANRDDNVGAVYIDYIQKVQAPSSQDQRYREIAKVTEELRETAQALDVAIIAGAQLNRNTTGRPKMNHLRESGDIEQDANLILGLVDGKKASETPEAETDDLYINIIKNREGPTKEEKLIPHKWDRSNYKITSR